MTLNDRIALKLGAEVLGRDAKGPHMDDREGGVDLSGAVRLMPTPTAKEADSSSGANPDWGHGLTLTDVARGEREDSRKLLPTPTAEDGERGRDGAGDDRLGAATFDDLPLLPTPVANPDNPGSGGELRAALTHGEGRRNETGVDTLGRPNSGRPSRLLPTPQAADGDGGRVERGAMRRGGRRPSGQKGTLTLGTAVELADELSESPFAEVEGTESLLPTPLAADGDRASEQGPRHYAAGDDNPTLLGAAKRAESAWGVYEGAIRRWETVLGRPAPAPTDEKGRLDPAFVEWMLGYPEGWIDLDGVSRTARLRMLGNSVQCQVGERAGVALVALDRELAA